MSNTELNNAIQAIWQLISIIDEIAVRQGEERERAIQQALRLAATYADEFPGEVPES